ncbi:YesL family protein [Anaeromicropila populeti]|uniref:Uncharacterized membrane protein YesL n=1 Tax=Anaeromicropila populeti TaxID=37658 RepID=A0A1I6IQY6_9FIRM|nr:YesL family protein [Anaeromicropila populeti]SFR69051.1 Uncharacterized membrane protein YesL [Anaeromicropila populeti]
MFNLFNLDNPVMRFLSKLFDLVYLSILWGLCCIPLVTVGAATTALYYTTVKVLRRERGYVTQEFIKSFKMNFVNGTIAWVLQLVLGILIVSNIQFAFALEGKFALFLICVYCFFAFLIIGVSVYFYPVLSRFTMKFSQVVKTCLFFMFKHLIRTLLMIVIVALFGFATFAAIPLIFFTPVCCCLLVSLVMEPVLKLYTPKEEDGENKDEWYLE